MNITKEQYKKSKKLIKKYEKQEKIKKDQEYIVKLEEFAKCYSELKQWLFNKKASNKISEWDSVHHQEVLIKMDSLEIQHIDK